MEKQLQTVRQKIFSVPSLVPVAEKLEAVTKVNVEIIVLGAGLIVALCLFGNVGAVLISTVIGFLYPAYATFTTLKNLDPSAGPAVVSAGERRFWLQYWVVFGIFGLLDQFVGIIMYWIPFYYPVKVTALLWAMSPQYRGAEILFRDFIQPMMISKLDAALNAAADKTKNQ